MTLYRIHWRYLHKDRTGSGSKGFSKEEALLMIADLDKTDSNFNEYWIEEEGSDTDGKLYEDGVEVYE